MTACGSNFSFSRAPTQISVPEGWKLVWHDEFDDKEINTANWTYDLGGGGWGNGESQVYTDNSENARLENGFLVIEAQKKQNDQGGFEFTSARMKTQGLQTFQYGRIEARIQVPEGAGFWPAFWMLGSNFPQVGWPDCGEIDIMEYVGKDPTVIMGTLHGPGYSGALGFTKWNRQTYNIADDFHLYAIEWDEDEISWFFDGEKYHTVTREDVGERQWPFDQPFFIIINLAVGGTLGGLINPSTVFPAQYLIDFVRVSQPTN
jgi:beta-glucanase (GH16 family)